MVCPLSTVEAIPLCNRMASKVGRVYLFLRDIVDISFDNSGVEVFFQ